MENQTTSLEVLLKETEGYVKTTAELYKLKIIDKSSEVISTWVMRLAVIVFIILFFLIVNIGIALWIGAALGRSYQGFFIVAGFYAFSGCLIFIFRNAWIKEPLKNSIITQALK